MGIRYDVLAHARLLEIIEHIRLAPYSHRMVKAIYTDDCLPDTRPDKGIIKPKNKIGAKSGDKNPMYGVRGDDSPSFKGFCVGYTSDKLVICAGSAMITKSGFSHGQIYACINGRIKTHKGYQWLRTMDKQVITELLDSREFLTDSSLEIYNQM